MRTIRAPYVAAIALALVLAFCAGGMVAFSENYRTHRSDIIQATQAT